MTMPQSIGSARLPDFTALASPIGRDIVEDRAAIAPAMLPRLSNPSCC